jgi:hypothetical protein
MRKSIYYYLYALVIAIIALVLATPILNSPSQLGATYTLLGYCPVVAIIRSLLSDKYKDTFDYLVGVLLLAIILILRYIYL